ncbi:MAG: hypothetical protein ACRDTG_05605 [Pseudonocardiaceae bacterium]
MDVPGLARLIKTLSEAADRMRAANDRLRAASAADLGSADLDRYRGLRPAHRPGRPAAVGLGDLRRPGSGPRCGVNGFTLELPAGFVALPAVVATTEVARAVEELFALPPGDPSAAKVAESLSALGLQAADDGAEYTSIGFFRSPDDPQRPVCVLLTAARMSSDHDEPSTVIAGLREVYASDPNTETRMLRLAAGPALTAVREEPAMIEIEGATSLPLLQRQILTWVPDPAGSAVAVIGLVSNAWRDWGHVCDLALEVVDSLSWADSGAASD